MKISVSVMAHPSRKDRADALLMELSKYPFSEVFIIWDEINEEWHTGRRAIMGGVFAMSDWHIVLQDDAIIGENFYSNVLAALKNVPMKSLVSFYVGQVRPIQGRVKLAFNNALIRNKSWLSFSGLMWGVGIAIPTEDISPMLKHVEKSREAYDRRIGSYYDYKHQPVYYTAISLVDHDDELGSIIGNGGTLKPRVAHQFVGNRKLTFNSKVENI